MSEYNFIQNQKVLVIADHTHIKASDTIYTVGSIDRISGRISVVLMLDDKCIGAVDQSCLRAR